MCSCFLKVIGLVASLDQLLEGKFGAKSLDIWESSRQDGDYGFEVVVLYEKFANVSDFCFSICYS